MLSTHVTPFALQSIFVFTLATTSGTRMHVPQTDSRVGEKGIDAEHEEHYPDMDDITAADASIRAWRFVQVRSKLQITRCVQNFKSRGAFKQIKSRGAFKTSNREVLWSGGVCVADADEA